jgi:hypothetical protein
LRNDIFAAAFGLLWILCAFRYLESRRTRWLVGVTTAMALSFASKETSFIYGAIIGGFFLGLTVFRAKLDGERWRESPSGELALLMFTLALPFAAPAIYLLLGWDSTDFDSEVAWQHLLMVVPGLVAVAAALAGVGLRFRRPKSAVESGHTRSTAERRGLVLTDWLFLFALFWGFQTLLFTTWFQNLPRGLISGFIGSVGYWLGQHEVARGGQPWFYYFLIVGLYELISLVLGVGAATYLLRRKG